MPKVRLEKQEWYPVYVITDTGGKGVKITRNLLNNYTRVKREFETLQRRLGNIFKERPKPPPDWRYNLPDTDPLKLYPKEDKK